MNKALVSRSLSMAWVPDSKVSTVPSVTDLERSEKKDAAYCDALQTTRRSRSKSVQRLLDQHYYQDDGSTVSCSTKIGDHCRYKRDGSTSARSKRSGDHKSRRRDGSSSARSTKSSDCHFYQGDSSTSARSMISAVFGSSRSSGGSSRTGSGRSRRGSSCSRHAAVEACREPPVVKYDPDERNRYVLTKENSDQTFPGEVLSVHEFCRLHRKYGMKYVIRGCPVAEERPDAAEKRNRVFRKYDGIRGGA
eukprot:gnl/TRDRNA2_/TRDRNA2_84979_c0_seq3.p1 gnl/TRDRNA2_/TRDRNA2_84979_c0~~gnl/TRDRNA2_/TRDRNA2_84979_c0_seq3.p1  ORF type:complete len:249 (+),score=21.46 gnl/TRDRNA2_/TRDRNA2_84979_c0_seq3:75-821(+)